TPSAPGSSTKTGSLASPRTRPSAGGRSRAGCSEPWSTGAPCSPPRKLRGGADEAMPEPLGGFAYTWPYYAAAICGCLGGSIPFGLLLTRLAGLGDIRTIGSGNIGATNVLRTGHKGLAALTLLLDGGKGALAVLIARRFGPDMAVLAGAGAVLGHILPVWIGFKGGKGVATALGVLLAIAWPVGVLAGATWLAVAFATRYSSLAALVAIGLA